MVTSHRYDSLRPNKRRPRKAGAMSESIVSINEEPPRPGIKEPVENTVRDVIDRLLEEEADELASAGRCGRAAGREAYRSGRCRRKPATSAGEAGPDAPRPRGATFRTAAIGRRRGRGTGAGEAVVEMRLAGVSTRRVEGASRIPWGAGASAGDVPGLNGKASAPAVERGSRPPGGERPCVSADGAHLRRGRGGPCENASAAGPSAAPGASPSPGTRGRSPRCGRAGAAHRASAWRPATNPLACRAPSRVCFVNLSFHKTASVRFTRQREDSSRASVALAPILSSPTTPRA